MVFYGIRSAVDIRQEIVFYFVLNVNKYIDKRQEICYDFYMLVNERYNDDDH